VEHDTQEHHNDFGFVTLDRPHTLGSFKAYADWVKALHFSDPPPKVSSWNTFHAATGCTPLF
jgi:hypothetical protein